jgi:hypothetical protein
MPWNQSESKFIRTNSIEFSGVDVWHKDQLASIKIIATRHDYHDQDIADGISRCLNIDGFNKMYANLDMNNYSIINLSGGTLPKDVATYDQIFDTMVFDDPSRTLTLSRPNGTDLTAVIPGGSTGGGGTVTQINPGTGIAMNPNPITGTGTVSLENLGNPKSASNGIGSITVDTYGRVTAVTGGFGAGYVTDVPSGTGEVYGRTDSGWVIIDTSGGGGGSLLTINMDSDSGNISIGGTGNSTIEIPLAGGGNAGLVTDAERQKINSIPSNPTVDPGQNTYDTLYWTGSKWADTAIFQINPFQAPFGVVVNGNHYVDGELTVTGQAGFDSTVYLHGRCLVIGEGVGQAQFEFVRNDAATNEKRACIYYDGDGQMIFCTAQDSSSGTANLANGSFYLLRNGADFTRMLAYDSDFAVSPPGDPLSYPVWHEKTLEDGNVEGQTLSWDNTNKIWRRVAPAAARQELLDLLSLLVTKGAITQPEADAIAT